MLPRGRHQIVTSQRVEFVAPVSGWLLRTKSNPTTRRGDQSAFRHSSSWAWHLHCSLTPACSSDDGDADEGDGLPEYEYDGPEGPKTLFKHGVASGDPLSDAVILWTRVTPKDDSKLDVWWEIATDHGVSASCRRRAPSRRGADRDFTVKPDVDGLKPATTYYYRFKALGRTSVVGQDAYCAGRCCFATPVRGGVVFELRRAGIFTGTGRWERWRISTRCYTSVTTSTSTTGWATPIWR